MAEFNILHATDIHDQTWKLEVLRQYAADYAGSDDEVDAVFLTGDFIEGTPKDANSRGDSEDRTIDRVLAGLNEAAQQPEFQAAQDTIRQIVEEHGENGVVKHADLDEGTKDILIEAVRKRDAITTPLILDTITTSYTSMIPLLEGIDEYAPIIGVAGNHDLTLAYEILGETITFVETIAAPDRVVIKGKTGIEMTIKGDFNSWEIPRAYSQTPLITAVVQPFSPDYDTGYSVPNLEATINIFTKFREDPDGVEIPEKLRKGLTKLRDNGRLEESISSGQEKLARLKEKKQAERTRLGKPEEVDIYLSHKLPINAADVTGNGPSEVTIEYASHASGVYAGHYHQLQIGSRHEGVEALLDVRVAEETTIIEGEEVPVIYIEDDEPWQFNPGTNYFAVTSYDADKAPVEAVIYEFIAPES